MASGGPLMDAALQLGRSVGRYFSLTSVAPSFILVGWLAALWLSGAVTGRPSMAELVDGFSRATVLGWLIAASFATAFVLHPFQFATVQFLEGYWGTGRMALAMARRGAVRHRRIKRDLESMRGESGRRWRAGVASSAPDGEEERGEGDLLWYMDSGIGDPFMGDLLGEREADRRLSQYPRDGHRVMPTLLGNALRRYEDLAGERYGLDAVSITPHLLTLSREAPIGYVQDSRQEMDTSVRLCLVGFLGAVAAVLSMLTDGWWLLLALLPYGLCYASYRGAVFAAAEYGTALTVLIDLNRFRLYERFGLRRPRDLTEEVKQNADLMNCIRRDPNGVLRYRPPEGGKAGGRSR